MKRFGDKFYTISNFNELNIIDIPTKTIERTVLFQDQNITAIHITDKLFLYADHFNYIYAIQLTDLEVSSHKYLTFPQNENMEKKTMMGHSSWVLDIISDDRFIYSCSDDKTVKVWDINTRKFMILTFLSGTFG